MTLPSDNQAALGDLITPKQEFVSRFVTVESSRDASARAETLLNENLIKIRHYDAESYTDGAIWSIDHNRTYGRMAHGFLSVSDWVGALDKISLESQQKLLVRIEAVVDAWMDVAKPANSMAYHDETTAQRVINLSHLHFRISRFESSRLLNYLASILESDVELLADPGFYSGNNNHGMFQDIGLLVYSALVEKNLASADRLEKLAFERLSAYFRSCFRSDGIHRENNPTYHLMVCRYLKDVVEYSDVAGAGEIFADLTDLLEKADTYASYALTPMGHFPPISDTKVIRITEFAANNTFQSGHLAAAVAGTSELPSTYYSEESGYAIYKENWSSRTAAFLFFYNAYNADYHKHSDENGIYFARNGIEIIREAGPYGYDQRDSFAKYGFTSNAHNSLLVNGRGLPRTDKYASLTRLRVHDQDSSVLRAVGSTSRYVGVKWDREIEVADASCSMLSIRDSLVSSVKRDFTILWHFGPRIEPHLQDDRVDLYETDSGTLLAALSWRCNFPTSARIISGQKYPDVQGWSFPDFGVAEPSSCLSVSWESSGGSVEWDLLSFEVQRDLDAPTDVELHREQPSGEIDLPTNVSLVHEANGKSKCLVVILSSSLDEQLAQEFDIETFQNAGVTVLRCATEDLYGNDDWKSYSELMSMLVAEVCRISNDIGSSMSNCYVVGLAGASSFAIGLSAVVGSNVLFEDFDYSDLVPFCEHDASEALDRSSELMKKPVYYGLSRSLLRGDRSISANLFDSCEVGDSASGSSGFLTWVRGLGFSNIYDFRNPDLKWFELLSNGLGALDACGRFVPHAVWGDPKARILYGRTITNARLRVRAQLVHGKTKIGSPVALSSGLAKWEGLESGVYRIRFFISNPQNEDFMAFTSRRIRI